MDGSEDREVHFIKDDGITDSAFPVIVKSKRLLLEESNTDDEDTLAFLKDEGEVHVVPNKSVMDNNDD